MPRIKRWSTIEAHIIMDYEHSNIQQEQNVSTHVIKHNYVYIQPVAGYIIIYMHY